MKYKLRFDEKALREWKELDNSVKLQFKKKLEERLKGPVVEKDRLRGMKNIFKIKLKKWGYRLAYRVNGDKSITVLIIGKREKSEVYKMLEERI
ncbi:MAG: type II toxin-antitoxin system RelE/ParE family toxin [bacterium]